MSAPAGTPTAQRARRRLPGWARGVLAVVGVLLAINVGLWLLDGATRGADESGARSSSFSTSSEGTAGYAELLRRYGADVERQRGDVRLGDLDPQATVIVLDAFPRRREVEAVAAHVRSGGRLVAGGPDAAEWARELTDRLPRWVPGGDRVRRATVDGSRYRVRTARDGRFTGEPSLVREPSVPGGSVVLLADASPLSNALLDAADNAAFGLALAGTDGTVTFVEGPHGYGRSTGLAAIPTRWKVALVLGTLGVLLALIAAARRIGPAERTARELPPPRRVYVDALGAALARTKRPAAALAPLQAAAREQIAARAGLAADADDAAIRAAAARAGWSDKEIDALFSPVDGDEAAVRAGRALARAERESQ